MKKTSITALVAGTALAALTFGCGDTANTNVRVNANNTAIVTNANNTNANVVNTNTSSSAYNRNYNARGDYDREAANYKAEAKNKGESVGQGIEDGWIHFKTRAALALVDDLRDSTINVDVDNGVITLRGDVGSAAQKAAAEKAAKGIEGQKGVKNNLAIKATGAPGDGPNKGTNTSGAGNTNAKKS